MIPYNCYVLKFPIHSVYMIPYNCYVFKIPIHLIHMIPYNCYVFLKFRIHQFLKKKSQKMITYKIYGIVIRNS